MAFELDTSGTVGGMNWAGLDPFMQGYVEALFVEWGDRLNEARLAAKMPLRRVRFSDLAPEALARIIEDCAAYQNTHDDLLGSARHPDPRRPGRMFWLARAHGQTAYPPLTAYLGDDGKVYLREAEAAPSTSDGEAA